MAAPRDYEVKPEQWQKAKAILETAAELTGAARESYLLAACAQDPGFLAEIKSLLEHYDDTGSFLEPSGASAPVANWPSQDEMIFLPGQVVEERFEVLKFIGRGGMGEVYQARDQRLNEMIAIKAISREALSEVTMARLKQEVLLARRIAHPNICRVFDLEQHKSHNETQAILFLTMEYVEGETLAEAMRRQVRMTMQETLVLLAQIARGLAASHAAGVIHRDLKPANVILDARHSTMRAVITDFGVAKRSFKADAGTDSLTESNQVIGTASYMAPEQIEGGVVTYATDIYALGLIMYEALAGTKPFAETGPFSSAVARLKGPPPSPRRYAAEIGSRLESLILGCLVVQPERRIQDAQTVARSLEELIEDPSRGTDACVSMEPGLRLTVAVLPFANMGPNEEDQYFSDGLTEELMGALARLRGLRVVARTSVFRFRHACADIRQVAGQLCADLLVEGTVRRSGDRVRVTVRLINAAEGCHIWNERYDRQMIDVLSMQDEIASTIAEQLKLKLRVGADPQVQRQQTRSLEAYESFLRGRFFWNKRTRSSLQKAEECFKLALKHDPEFVDALAALAQCYVVQEKYAAKPPHEVYSLAKDAVLKVLALDPNLAEAHCAAGFIHAGYDWDWPAVERSFQRALELDPGYATAHHWYGLLYLVPRLRMPEARMHLQLARQKDPLSLVIGADSARVAYYDRRYDDAIRDCLRVLEMDPAFGVARMILGQIYTEKRMHAEAIGYLRLAATDTEESSLSLAALGYAQGRAGFSGEARQLLNHLKEQSKTHYVSPFHMAQVALGLQCNGEALEYLDEALKVRALIGEDMALSPVFDSVRSTPEFCAICRQIGLPERTWAVP